MYSDYGFLTKWLRKHFPKDLSILEAAQGSVSDVLQEILKGWFPATVHLFQSYVLHACLQIVGQGMEAQSQTRLGSLKGFAQRPLVTYLVGFCCVLDPCRNRQRDVTCHQPAKMASGLSGYTLQYRRRIARLVIKM